MPFDVPRNFQSHVQAGLDSENLTGKAKGDTYHKYSRGS